MSRSTYSRSIAKHSNSSSAISSSGGVVYIDSGIAAAPPAHSRLLRSAPFVDDRAAAFIAAQQTQLDRKF